MIRVENISLQRGGNPILENISLSIAAGELLGIVGPNGAGKSTLLRVMTGILQPDSGVTSTNGEALPKRSRRTRAQEVAYLPQHPECHWAMTVERVVTLGRLPHLSLWQGPTETDAAAIRNAMRDTDILPLAARNVGTLSGGEFARVMLARALAATPKFLLADEPVADLDPFHSLEVMDHLQRLTRTGVAVAVVLHDLSLAARFCTRIALMDRGRIVTDDEPTVALSRENLRSIYQIEALYGEQDGTPFLLPWSRLEQPRGTP